MGKRLTGFDSPKTKHWPFSNRIGIVTSGRCLSHDDVENVCAALREMHKATDIGLCASLGLLSEDDLAKLKAAGLQRVHCNIETAPSLFPSLCSTHTMADKTISSISRHVSFPLSLSLATLIIASVPAEIEVASNPAFRETR